MSTDLATEIRRVREKLRPIPNEPQVTARSIWFGDEERVISLQTVDGVLLIGTDKRVLEFDSAKGLRTLAIAEDRT